MRIHSWSARTILSVNFKSFKVIVIFYTYAYKVNRLNKISWLNKLKFIKLMSKVGLFIVAI